MIVQAYSTTIKSVDFREDSADIFVGLIFGRREGTVLIKVELENGQAVDYEVSITPQTNASIREVIQKNLIDGSAMSEGFQLFVMETIKKQVIDRAEILRSAPKPHPGRFAVEG